MSVSLYDKAIVNKISNWIVDKKLTLLAPEDSKAFFQKVADTNKDRITLPLISISRDRDINIQLTNKRPAQYMGRVFNISDKNSDHLNQIPITLNYQIDIYTRYQEEAEDYFRNFVFNIIDYPAVQIEIPYLNSGLIQKSYMELLPEVQDNSDVPEKLIQGQFTRLTLRFTLKDAHLFSYTIDPLAHVSSVEIKGNLASNVKEENKNHYEGDKCEELTPSIDIQ